MKRLVLAVILASVGVSLAARAADPTATVAQGVLVGTMDNGVAAFLGVPFAAPPVGDLRWAPPKPAAMWSAPRQAKAFAPAC
ncbi:MAG TPA: carboxylesterase family protein, partial [Vicinamibacterales bacterium]|nr:carboxylesterase family protein [Vicinamibacterales bacterium]